MPNGLQAENLLYVLPEVLRQDDRMQALAVGIADILAARRQEIDRLLLYPRIDDLPEELLDRMAYDFKVDWWDADYTLVQKRRTLKANWQVHRQLGTRAAVERAIRAIYPNTQVLEWFEYDGGEPYHFKLNINLTGNSFDRERQQRVLDRVEYYKNLRSHLDGVYYFVNVDPIIFHNPEVFRLSTVKLPFYFSNLPNGGILLNGRRRLDGTWLLDSTFRGVNFVSLRLQMGWQEQSRPMAAGAWAARMSLQNSNRSLWQGLNIAGTLPNITSGSSKSLGITGNLDNRQPTNQAGSLTKDTMWRLDGSMSLDGSKKLNAAITKEEL